MTFIPREPVVQNPFMVSAASLTASAGDVVYISGDETVTTTSGTSAGQKFPFGFLMQNVKAENTTFPTGYRAPSDLGTSDAFSGEPVAVAHFGIYDTDRTMVQAQITAGDVLYPTGSGVISRFAHNAAVGSAVVASGGTTSPYAVAVALNTLTATQLGNGKFLRIKLLI